MGEGWRLEREGREEPPDKLGEILFKEAGVGRGEDFRAKRGRMGAGGEEKEKGKGKKRLKERSVSQREAACPSLRWCAIPLRSAAP